MGDGRELLLVIALVLAAGLVRLPLLWQVPVFTDEGDEALVALRIIRDGARPLTNDDAYIGPLFNYLLAAVFGLAGPSPWSPRLVTWALGTVTVLSTYLLARECVPRVWGVRAARTCGTLAAMLVIVNPVHVVVNSHIAWSGCTTPLFTTLGAWLVMRGVRDGIMSWRALTLAGLCLGVALQSHPVALGPVVGLGLFVLTRHPGVLRLPGTYLAVVAFLVPLLPLMVHNAQTGGLASVAAAQLSQSRYNRGEQFAPQLYPEWLWRLLFAFGAELVGLIDDRVNQLPWFAPAAAGAGLILLGAAIAFVALRGLILPAFVLVTTLLLLPLFHGQFLPLANNGRYVAPLIPVSAAAVSAAVLWVGRTFPSPVPVRVAASLMATIAIISTVSLVAHLQGSVARGQTNASLIASLAALAPQRGPSEPVLVDRALHRDWTLTEGRLGRVLASWLSLEGTPYEVVDIGPDGRLSGRSGPQGGLLIMARGNVPLVERFYSLTEISSGAAIEASEWRGYLVARAVPR
ncbi:MAG: glycosyltransferase family 39 protein [Chloroflexota bacterium]